ncbi:MAG: Holliday junction branch migration protein RuvA, partial [Lachnospiraceae bacterium]|nr:Holliday junction branch migration protein RuvA [Lachnospiraceae bacterium]
IMELKDKLTFDDVFAEDKDVAFATSAAGGTGGNNSVQDTVLALVSLGYSEFEAMKAIKQVDGAEAMEADALLKAALKKVF